MILEVGKKYRTRGGECVEISGKLEGSQEYPFISNRYIYTPKGLAFPDDLNHPDNLISEWEEPAQDDTPPDAEIIKLYMKLASDDPELTRLIGISVVFKEMTPAEQYRALSYLNSRYRDA